MGTYYNPWRIILDNKIICASNDTVDSIEELDAKLKKINLGCLQSFNQVSRYDMQAVFDSGVIVDFMSASSDDDEFFHIFCPGNVCLTYSLQSGWKASPSVLNA